MKLSQEAREAQRAYLREWRRRNPDKVKRHTKDFWERKARELQQKGANGHDNKDKTNT